MAAENALCKFYAIGTDTKLGPSADYRDSGMRAERAPNAWVDRRAGSGCLVDAGLADVDGRAGDETSICSLREVASAAADRPLKPASESTHTVGDRRHRTSREFKNTLSRHLTLKLSCEGPNGKRPNAFVPTSTGATPIKEVAPRQLQRPLGCAGPRWPPLHAWTALGRCTLAKVVIDQRLIRHVKFIGEVFEVRQSGLVQAHRDGLLELFCVWAALGLREIVLFSHRFHRAPYWARSDRVARRAEIRRMMWSASSSQ